MNMLDPDFQLEQQLTPIDRNEQSVLQVMQVQTDLLQNLSELADYISAPREVFEAQIDQTFRKLYQNVENISNLLQKYQSDNEQFLQQKDYLSAEQIKYMEIILSNIQGSEDLGRRYQKSSSRQFTNQGQQYQGTSEEDQRTIMQLEQQLDTLNQTLGRNNFEFEEEIKKYNHRLYEMRDTIQRYEIQRQKMADYELIIDDLENKIFLLREEKNRDTLLIENMAKKIRFFQKERGGRDVFLSPYQSDRSRYIMSPSSRPYNLTKTNTSFSKQYP